MKIALPRFTLVYFANTCNRIFCRVFFFFSFFSKDETDGQILCICFSPLLIFRFLTQSDFDDRKKSARIMTNKCRGKYHFLL